MLQDMDMTYIKHYIGIHMIHGHVDALSILASELDLIGQ